MKDAEVDRLAWAYAEGRSTPCARCKDGPLDVEAVAALLGVQPATVRQGRWRQTIPPEDGTVSGRPYWWPATIAAWTKKAPAAGR